MDFLELAKARYSCRKFSDRPVEAEKIEKIIEAGIAAPTAVNTQPFRIWHMASPEAKDAIRSVTDYHFGAENFLVVGYNTEESWTRKFDARNFADVDAAIVATHMMLEIQDLGLASTWVGHFDAPKLQKLCPQMAGFQLIAIFPIGYAAEGQAGGPAPKHFVRKDKEQLVITL